MTGMINRLSKLYKQKGLKACIKKGVRWFGRRKTIVWVWNTLPFVFLVNLTRGKVLYRKENYWVLYDIYGSNTFYFPKIEYWTSDTTRSRKKKRYYKSNNISIEEGDVVVDVGAYFGITSIVAADDAKIVYAIEPSPRNLRYLRKNTKKYDNIVVLPCAAWKENGKIEINIGSHPSEDSLIVPDDGNSNESKSVKAKTIESIVQENKMESIDFLKVEAEGVEPEVLRGIGKVSVHKVACTGDAERYGKTTHDEVNLILRKKGYKTYKNLEDSFKMVYGIKKSQDNKLDS